MNSLTEYVLMVYTVLVSQPTIFHLSEQSTVDTDPCYQDSRLLSIFSFFLFLVSFNLLCFFKFMVPCVRLSWLLPAIKLFHIVSYSVCHKKTLSNKQYKTNTHNKIHTTHYSKLFL